MGPDYIRYKDVPLVGAGYEDTSEVIKKMSLVTKVHLNRESFNEFDKNAISVNVLLEDIFNKVGYVPKGIAKNLSLYLDNNYAVLDVLIRSIQRVPLFTRKEGHRTLHVFNMDILMTNQTLDSIRKRRERYLSDIEYTENRFYFHSVFEQELKNRFLSIKKGLPLYDFHGKDAEFFSKIKKMQFYSKDFMKHLGFDDFAANKGVVCDFLNLLDIGITVEKEGYKLSMFYKGYPLRDSDLLRDFHYITNSETEALKELWDFNRFSSVILHRFGQLLEEKDPMLHNVLRT